MERMKEQNERIKQRRKVRSYPMNGFFVVVHFELQEIEADKEASILARQSELKKAQQERQVQNEIDGFRKENMQRKLAQIKTREWDSAKQFPDGPSYGDNRVRGRGGARGRGRGGRRGSWQDKPPDDTAAPAA
jgi:hypothetical protein